MLSGATWCFESRCLVHAVIGGGRDVVSDNRWQHDQLPWVINSRCSEGQRYIGYALMAEISEDAFPDAMMTLNCDLQYHIFFMLS